MKHRTTSGLAAFALGSALVLTGCGDGDDSSSDASASPSASAESSAPAVAEPVTTGGVCEAEEAPETEAQDAPEPTEADLKALEAVEITGKVGEKPKKVEFETPLAVEGLAVDVIDEGSGDELVEGDQITFQDYIVNGEDGEQPTPSTWDEGQGAQSFTLGDPQFQILNEPFSGVNVGARLTIAMQGMDGATQVHVIDVVGSETLPTKAVGTAVEPEPGLPTVELAEDGEPTVTIADDFEDPSELVVQPLIEGDGAEVTKEDQVTANYIGCLLDGTSFDASWSSGQPVPFALSQVIPGWTEGLAGQKVGSQVLLVIPGDKAYADQPPQGSPIPADATLVFVVDILDAAKA
ncbi:FKBP-type peptidyl-prolyl cis-trans isomerase [Myceligenerans cantabricum]